MCDYSLHAMATRPAQVGETLITTTFRGTSTRGFASEREPDVAVCMLPGTELAFAENVKYDNRWIWTRTVGFRVGKFNTIDPHVPGASPRRDRISGRKLCAGDAALRGQQVSVCNCRSRIGRRAPDAGLETPSATSIFTG